MHLFAVTPSFEPKRGKFMAYNKGKEIVIVDTTKWEIKKKLTDENVSSLHDDRCSFISNFSVDFCRQMKSEYSVCCYSPCGTYIAAGGTNGEIVIWNIESNQLIREEKGSVNEAQCIAAINWNPSNNGELAYTDNTGQLGLAVNIFDGDNEDGDNEDLTSVADDNGIDFDGSKSLRILDFSLPHQFGVFS